MLVKRAVISNLFAEIFIYLVCCPRVCLWLKHMTSQDLNLCSAVCALPSHRFHVLGKVLLDQSDLLVNTSKLRPNVLLSLSFSSKLASELINHLSADFLSCAHVFCSGFIFFNSYLLKQALSILKKDPQFAIYLFPALTWHLKQNKSLSILFLIDLN